MNKAQKRAGTVLVLLLAVIILVGNLPSLKSIFIGGAVSYRYIYVNTYDYPSMAQQPAIVKWSFSPNGASASSGTCTTSLELFNYGSFIIELDAPVSTLSGTSTGVYPLSQAYASASKQNVNLDLCLIQIPLQSLSTPPNTTIGTLFLQATGTNGYSSGVYSASLSINPSLYGWTPILITLPLTNQTITSTTTTTSTTTSSSTTSSTTTINSTTAVPQPPVNQNSGFFSNIISSIQNAIRSFINSIINALKW